MCCLKVALCFVHWRPARPASWWSVCLHQEGGPWCVCGNWCIQLPLPDRCGEVCSRSGMWWVYNRQTPLGISLLVNAHDYARRGTMCFRGIPEAALSSDPNIIQCIELHRAEWARQEVRHSIVDQSTFKIKDPLRTLDCVPVHYMSITVCHSLWHQVWSQPEVRG